MSQFIMEPKELFAALQGASRPILIDVREPEEHEKVAIDGSRLIPLMSVPDHLEELRRLSDEGRNTMVLICRSGQRSQMALEFLESEGLENLKNLRGGINAYAKEADTSLSPY